MKKHILPFILSLVLVSFTACSNAEAEKKAADEKEVLKMDSLAKEIEQSEDSLKEKTEDLEKSLEELKDIAPKGR